MNRLWFAFAALVALLIAMSELAKRHNRMHYFMAGIAALGVVFLTAGHVWRVMGVGQTLFSYIYLVFSGVDHFKKGRIE